MKENVTFEELMIKLEETSEKLKSGDLPLQEALKEYEKGLTYYSQCNELLEEAKQKIEVYEKKRG